MNLLKRENWWVWLLLTLFTSGGSCVLLGALFDCFDKDAWYAKWENWLIGFICFVFPAVIMAAIFFIEMTCKTAAKLNISGKELYLSPYVWIICIIIPFIGWLLFSVMVLYLTIMVLVKLHDGEAEKFI